MWEISRTQILSVALRTTSRAHLDLGHPAAEPENHCRTQTCCGNLSLPAKGERHTGVTPAGGRRPPGCIAPFSPVRWLACSQDREGCWGRTWARAPRGASLPGQPRAASPGGRTPTPTCPAGGCSAGAGVLNKEITTHIVISAHFKMREAF